MKNIIHINPGRTAKLRTIILLLLALYLIPQCISARYKNLHFKNYYREDGLSVCFITSIIQDRDGFLWFGTYGGGINRFDGYNFKAYHSVTNREGGFIYSFIKTIYEDRNGIIWIGTIKDGLSRFDKNTEQFINYTHNPEDSNSISGNTVNAIYMDTEGNLWIGCELHGLNRFDEKSNRFIHYRSGENDTTGSKGNSVRAICEDSYGNIWIGTNKGLKRLDKTKEMFYHYINNAENTADFNDKNNITRCYADKENGLWIGTVKGFYKFNYVNDKEYHFYGYNFGNGNEIHVTSIHRDRNGFLWIGTNRSGLYILNPVTEEFNNYRSKVDAPNSLPNNRMSSNKIVEDRSGNFWLGTNFGASKCSMHNKKFRFYRYNESIAGWTIFEDKKSNVWITGKDNFHIRDNNGDFKIISYEPPVKPFMTTNWGYKGICDRTGVIWLGYQNVLCKYNSETGEMEHFYTFPDSDNLQKPVIKILFEDSDSLLWIGTTEGVWVFDKERKNAGKYFHNERDPYSINSDEAHCFIYEDRNKGIWISLFNMGADRYDKKTGKFEHYQHNPLDVNSIGSNLVCSLYDDGNGSIWFAACAGLDKLDLSTKTFTHYTEKDGLADKYTYSILPDNSGNIWVSTNSGISKFNPFTKTFRNYEKKDGLENEEYTDIAYRTRNGELFFSGMKGINSFYPDSITENSHIPPVYITSFKIFDKEIEPEIPIEKTEEIRLSHNENFFSFEFAALDFTNPEKNKYAYKLEGVDKEWRHSGKSRTAKYTNIDHGEYVFRVKGSNDEGLWNEAGTSVRIIISPPFWASWWFRTIYISLFLGMVGFLWHTKHIKVKKELQKQKDFTKQLIESQEKEQKRIANELHDSLGQNLLIIQNKVLAEMDIQNENKKLDDISKLTTETIQEIRRIAYNLHPYQLEQLGLTKAVHSIINRASESTKIKFISEVDEIDKLFSHEIEINIFRMIQESIHNVIEHSKATELYISVLKDSKEVSIHIKDNGIGFDIFSEKAGKGLGIMSLKERADYCNANVKINSLPGKGTLVDISIPIPKNK